MRLICFQRLRFLANRLYIFMTCLFVCFVFTHLACIVTNIWSCSKCCFFVNVYPVIFSCAFFICTSAFECLVSADLRCISVCWWFYLQCSCKHAFCFKCLRKIYMYCSVLYVNIIVRYKSSWHINPNACFPKFVSLFPMYNSSEIQALLDNYPL